MFHTSLYLTVLLTLMSSPRSGPHSGSCTRVVTLSSQRPSDRESRCKMDGWDVWLCLGEDSHGPLQVVLAGLVDLDDLSSLKSFFTLSFQWPSVMELHWMDGSMDGWINGSVLGKTARFHTSLILLVSVTSVGLTSPRLVVALSQGIALKNSSCCCCCCLRRISRIARPCLNSLLRRISRRQKLNVLAPRNVLLSSLSEPLLPLKKESRGIWTRPIPHET
jgi:hypothetical protein